MNALLHAPPVSAGSRAEHVASYYAATATPTAGFAALAGDLEADVCVIGGGIAGCSTALHLAERGYRVVLLEAKRVGWGASGRNGGQAIFGISCGQEKIERYLGKGDARTAFDVTVEGVKLLRSRIARHAIACDWRPGIFQAALKPRQLRELAADVEALAALGYCSPRFVERDELATMLASERYLGGLYDPESGHLHPLNYTLGLATAAVASGVRLFEGSAVLSYQQAAKVTVRTAQGSVKADHVVICANAYVNGLARALDSRIMPVLTYIVATQKLGDERARALIPNDMAVADVNNILDYFRLSADGRMLFGGRVSYSGYDPLNTESATRARMLRVFPQLADAKIEFSWGGFVDITLNRAPHFGRLAPNVYFLQGFSGHGVVLTGIAGKLVAEAIAGTAERFDIFARIPHTGFPGGALLRRPALVLGMLYYRLRDLL
ncbi:MAG TPA: FAD-binding oxidoreductase [Steroidobacteraceae bacterium]|nr:FAD-binding oxidoreductase [Steroidobacteraceae bacterium]